MSAADALVDALGKACPLPVIQSFTAEAEQSLNNFVSLIKATEAGLPSDLSQQEIRVQLIEGFAGFLLSSLKSLKSNEPGDEVVFKFNLTPSQKAAKGAKQDTKANMTNKPKKLVIAAKRPLNSWMAFRAFYSPVFAGNQQKEISDVISTLWKHDFCKAKWTIIARAYSTIRDDVGKDKAPLDQFLNQVCPVVGIIPAAFYLPIMGWEMADSGLVRTRVVTQAHFTPGFASTNLSPEALVNHCIATGYYTPTAATGKSQLLFNYILVLIISSDWKRQCWAGSCHGGQPDDER
jgi:Mating-type protein MAT alpha 1 HMG-box